MCHFEFVLVFVSIVVAFAVSDFLESWGEQIRLRRQLQHYPLQVGWSALLLFVLARWKNERVPIVTVVLAYLLMTASLAAVSD